MQQRSLSKKFTSLMPTNQAYSPALPVGTQHHYKNSIDALSTIWRAEKFRGLIRGVDAAMLRTACGSAVSWFSMTLELPFIARLQVQLPTYNWTKNHLVNAGLTDAGSIWTFLASSSVSGVCVVRFRFVSSTPF